MLRRFFLTILVVSAACKHSTPPVSTPVPVAQVPSVAPGSPSVRSQQLPPLNEGLPPIPQVDGPLAIRVVYPSEGAPLAARDSNYLLGSVGNGSATLTINGQPATVYPNGAFMAFIKSPPQTSPKFDFVAVAGTDTVRYTHNLRTPTTAAPLPTDGKLIVDSTEFA